MTELIEAYYRQVEAAYVAKKLSQTCYERLISRDFEELDDFDEPMADFIHSLQHAEYYIILDRIEKGEGKIASEPDPEKKSQYSKLLNELVRQMEELKPVYEALESNFAEGHRHDRTA